MSSTKPNQSPPQHPPDEPDEREKRTTDPPVGARIWSVVSSTWLGVSLLLILAVAYGILTYVEKLSGPKSILPPVGSIYSHWSVLTLTLALCANLLFATSRIPVSWDRAGAWCSHLGLMFLAAGSMVFWQTRTEGQCFIPRERDGSWPTIRHFFQTTDNAACHVYDTALMRSSSPLPPTVQTVFESPSGVEPVDIDVDIDVPASAAPEGVSIKATRIYPRTELRQKWLNDAARITPAVEMQFSHGGETVRTIMCQSYEDTYRLNLHDCIVVFQASKAMDQEEIDRKNASREPTTRPSRQFFVIHYTGRGRPVLVAGSASGKLQRREFTPGQSVSPARGEHPTSIKLIRTLDRARRSISIEALGETEPGRAAAAIKLAIKSGAWKANRIVPYGAYLSGRPTTIQLPSGRKLYVAFSHSWMELPEPIRITRHEFKTAPASRMPEDYICDLEIGSGVHIRRETLQLNFPVVIGPYRLHQSTWQPKEESPSDYNDPSSIVLGVADRPGILLIFVGGIAVCLGFPYAFYVKPLILRSRAGRAS